MWLLKKSINNPVVTKEARSIICIPGNWKNFDAFKAELVVSSGGTYMVVGDILLHAAKQRHYTIEFCNRNERMYESFKYAGLVTKVTEKFLSEIEKHKFVIYISGVTGNLEEAELIALAGNAVLKAGGLGIKIESAGKAFEKDSWAKLMENFTPSTLYQMFVIDSITNEDGSVFSCGMHNLGLKDTIISGEEFQYAVDMISIFGYYQIVDKPTIRSGQTFRADASAQIFRIIDDTNQPYKEDEILGNPFGMWRLTGENINSLANR